MSVQAAAWAWDQTDPPPKVKLILLAMANHADHSDGRVHFDADTIAREANTPVKSLWRYLGALARNGFLLRDDLKGQDGKTAPQFWLVIDRPPAAWDWGRDASDMSEMSEDPGPSESAESDAPRPAPSRRAAPSTAPGPAGFDRSRQVQSRADAKAAEPERPPFVFVVKGSRAWDAWIEYRRSRGEIASLPCYSATVDGQPKWGCHRETLFPPGQDAATADDVSALADEGRRR